MSKTPFTFSVDKANVNNEYLGEIIELQLTQVQQQLFRTAKLSTFWCHQIVAYAPLPKKASGILIQFVTTYLSEQSFSKMVDITTKKKTDFVAKMT